MASTSLQTIPLVYVAGPYRSADPAAKRDNIVRAHAAGERLKSWRLCLPVVPHLLGDGPDEIMLPGLVELMKRCDAVLVLPGYAASIGTLAERSNAIELGMPLFYAEDDLRDWLRRRSA